MIIAKYIRAVSVILVLSVILCACAALPEEDFPFIADGDGEMTRADEYRIIVSQRASADLTSVADELCSKISDQTGVLCYVATDAEIFEDTGHVVEVIVGNTERAATKKSFYSMRAEDYTCRYRDGAVVMGGLCDSATITAIDRFCREILPLSNEFLLIPSGGGFDFKGEYELDSLTLNRVSIDRYTISYEGFSDEDGLTACRYLRDTVSKSTGFVMSIEGDCEGLSYSTLHLVCDSKMCDVDEAVISPADKGIYIYARDTEGLRAGVDRFISILLDASNVGERDVAVNIAEDISVGYVRADVTVGSLLSTAAFPMSSAESMTYTVGLIEYRSPELFLLGGIDPDERAMLESRLCGVLEYNTAGGVDVGFVCDTVCDALMIREADGLITEVYKIDQGELEFVLVRISGRVDTDTEVSLPKVISDIRLPVVAVIHTEGEGVLTLTDELYLLESAEKKVIKERRCVSIYCDTDSLDVTVGYIQRDISYAEIHVAPKNTAL